jgi:hypothetical protein
MAGNTSLTRTYNKVFSIMQDELASDVIFDNITTRTSLFYSYKLMNAIDKVNGRPLLRYNIMKELPTATGYSDLDTITPERGDPVTSAVYEWKQVAAPVQVSGLDMIKTGDDGVEDLLALMITAAETSLRESLGGSSIGIFSSAEESNVRAVTGLQNILGTSTTTGTVGNINRATQTAWQHQSQNVSSAFSTNGLNRFRTLYRQCSYFDIVPNVIVLNGSTMDNYERDLTSSFIVNLPIMGISAGNEMMIEAGFPNIRYKGALVFADDGVPANAGYFLNVGTYLRLVVRLGRESELGDFVKAQNKDDLVAWVYFAGNQVATGLRYMGILQNADTY